MFIEDYVLACQIHTGVGVSKNKEEHIVSVPLSAKVFPGEGLTENKSLHVRLKNYSTFSFHFLENCKKIISISFNGLKICDVPTPSQEEEDVMRYIVDFIEEALSTSEITYSKRLRETLDLLKKDLA